MLLQPLKCTRRHIRYLEKIKQNDCQCWFIVQSICNWCSVISDQAAWRNLQYGFWYVKQTINYSALWSYVGFVAWWGLFVCSYKVDFSSGIVLEVMSPVEMFQLLLPLNNIFNDLMIKLSNDKQNSFCFCFCFSFYTCFNLVVDNSVVEVSSQDSTTEFLMC